MPNMRDFNRANGNTEYGFKGSTRIKPVLAFDDGVKTWIEFRPETETPAIFLVDKDRTKASSISAARGISSSSTRLISSGPFGTGTRSPASSISVSTRTISQSRLPPFSASALMPRQIRRRADADPSGLSQSRTRSRRSDIRRTWRHNLWRVPESRRATRCRGLAAFMIYQSLYGPKGPTTTRIERSSEQRNTRDPISKHPGRKSIPDASRCRLRNRLHPHRRRHRSLRRLQPVATLRATR